MSDPHLRSDRALRGAVAAGQTLGAERFTYHRSIAPLMWVFVAIATIELVTVHLLVALLWSHVVAAVLSVATLGGIGWLVSVIASMRCLPVLIDRRSVTMRVGTFRSVTIPLVDVAGLRTMLDAAALRDRRVLNLALIAYPNVIVDLARPLPGRRAVCAIAHRLDDPAAFAAAFQRLGDADD